MKSSGDVRSQSNVFNNIGDVQGAIGQRESASESYAEALRLRTTLNDHQGQGYTHMSFATAYAEWGDHEQAAHHFKEALSLSRAIEDRRTEIFSLYGLSKMAAARGELMEAKANIESAINLMESLRFKLVDPELRATYFTSASDLYDLQIDILLQLHDRDPAARLSEAAFEASERARARNLLDTLAEARVNFRQGADPALLQKERSLREKIAAKADQQLRLLNGKHTGTQAEAVRRELESLVNDLHDVEAETRKASPRYAALTQPHVATVAEVQSKLLDSDTVLLEYALGERQSYLWAVSKSSVSGYKLPGRDVLEAAAKRLYAAASVRQRTGGAAQPSSPTSSPGDQATVAATALSRLLLEPVAELIRGKRLLVVADGSLRYVPFGLLAAPGAVGSRVYAPLIVDHEIVSLSSASSLLAIRDAPANRHNASKLVAVFADPVFDKMDARVTNGGPAKAPESGQRGPDASSSETPDLTNLERSVGGLDLSRGGFTLPRLPFTRREADAILAATPRDKGFLALDFQASIQTLNTPAIRDYKVVHFATHGLLNTSQPELSGLVFSLVDQVGNQQRGFLELADIYSLNLSADLIVLSACQTGLGKEVKGEGLVGLTRGFLYGGAKGVVASLWKVDDAATASLMEDFYKGMFSGRLSPAAALRRAEIKIWNQHRWASPYFWGGFIYEGDWR
jgi:CHAT domain-containing protein